eukprot:gnl/MRDRNA2_/MRDRNA2_16842_c0_seq1.p1 gnl/MRDRNA2_/MRDRNA2_16842_c0~~gnl/MRDRNA2_/MRDRNA2_16842_c0_seq1.p1  ORF type:complete len:490 (-),score=72.94 gnl/MRDRNA2_/MRDRNA2_16842_c0_seq1:37-1353(-)
MSVRAIHKERYGECIKYGDDASSFLSVDVVSNLLAEDRVASMHDGGVWIPEGVMSSSSNKSFLQSEASSNSLNSMKTERISYAKGTYGFYLHTFKQAAASVHLLREVRRVYPHDPIYIMSDGGLDFSGICRQIRNCNFQWRPPANDRWNPMPFLHRFQEAARWLQTKYIVMLEPDVTVSGKMDKAPDSDSDAGGVNDGNRPLSSQLLSYLEKQGQIASGNPNYQLKWQSFGFTGGSFFSADVVLHAFDPDSVNWREMRRRDTKRIWSSDVAMALVLAAHGFSYYPWSEVTQSRYGLKKDAAWRHWGRDEFKPHYSDQLSAADRTLVTPYLGPKGADVTCQGCVWVSDKVCWSQKPPTCPTTSGTDAVWGPVSVSSSNNTLSLQELPTSQSSFSEGKTSSHRRLQKRSASSTVSLAVGQEEISSNYPKKITNALRMVEA